MPKKTKTKKLEKNKSNLVRKLLYVFSSLIVFIASLIAITESKWVKKHFLNPPEIVQLIGYQPVPNIRWDKFADNPTFAIDHEIPVRLINGNDIPLQIKGISIDWGEIDVGNVLRNIYRMNSIGISNSVFQHVSLAGDCIMATRYDTLPQMMEGHYKDFADFPFTINPHEELRMFLSFKLFIRNPKGVIYMSIAHTTENLALLRQSMPRFFGFDGPNSPKDRIQSRNGIINIYTDYGTFNITRSFALPFPGTRVKIDINGKPLFLNFE